jgi:hypothetical protein
LIYSLNRWVYYTLCKICFVHLLLKAYFGLPVSSLILADWEIWDLEQCLKCACVFDRNNYVHTIWVQTEFYTQCIMWRNIYLRESQLQMLYLLREANRLSFIWDRQISSNLCRLLKTVLGLILSWYIIQGDPAHLLG